MKILNNPPYTVSDLGVAFSYCGSSLWWDSWFTYNGDTYLFMTFQSNATQAIVINLSDGTYYITSALTANPGSFFGVLHSVNHKIYYINSNNKMYEIDWLGQQTIQRIDLSNPAIDSYNGYITEGDDNYIYLTTSPEAHVVRYDTLNNTHTDLGALNSGGDGLGWQTGVDGSYAYVSVRSTTLGNYLGVLRFSDSYVQLFWQGQAEDVVNVALCGDNLYYAAVKISGTWLIYRLSGLTQTLVDGSYWTPQYQKINLGWANNGGGSAYPWPPPDYQILWDDGSAIGDVSTGTATVYWNYNNEGWNTGLELSLNSASKGLSCGYSGGSYVIVNPDSSGGYVPLLRQSGNDPPEILGPTECSVYEMPTVGGKFYPMGYTAAFMEWNPASSWTLNPTNVNDPSANPHVIGLSGAYKYFYYAAIGPDGLVYSLNNNSGSGASPPINNLRVYWYDPTTTDNDYYDFGFSDSTYLVRAVTVAGNNLIISTTLAGGTGRLYYFSTVSKTVVDTCEPFSGVAEAGRIVYLGNNILLGVIRLDDASTHMVYALNLSTKTVVYDSGTLTGEAFKGTASERRRLQLGPDGYAWLYIDSNICRINPNTYAVEVVKAADPPAVITIVGNDLYVMGNGQTNIRKIADLLYDAYYSKGNYSSLPENDEDLSTLYTSEQISDLADDDTDMVAQLATSQIAIHQFKRQINGIGGIIDTVAQVTIPCSTSTAYLQIYNRSGTPAWDTIDSDNATGANTDFPLSATVADLTDYKDENNIVACRIYQEMQ